MERKVKDIMSSNIIAVLPSDNIFEAAKLMDKHKIGAVPVVSAGELKGMITDRDIVLRCIAKDKDVKSVKASDLMSTDLVFLTPEQTVRDATQMMSDNQIRRLPVVDNGHIDGMVSLADIAKLGPDAEIAQAICEISKYA